MAKNKKVDGNLVTNRKARHEYFIEDVYEAGLVLKGTEVKSIRKGSANIQDAYISFKNEEAFIENMHISPYEQGNIFNVDPLRDRKLLLHKQEIGRLAGLVSREGLTLIPLSLYLKNGRVKVALGVCKGKKDYDKRNSLLEKAHNREVQRELKNRNRY